MVGLCAAGVGVAFAASAGATVLASFTYPTSTRPTTTTITTTSTTTSTTTPTVPTQPPAQVTMTLGPSYVSFRNQDATWRIYTHCADGVGPGYVAKVPMNGTVRVLLDDTTGARKDVNGDGFYRLYTGLGKLIFLDAVANQNAPIDWRQNNLSDTGGANDAL